MDRFIIWPSTIIRVSDIAYASVGGRALTLVLRGAPQTISINFDSDEIAKAAVKEIVDALTK